MPYINRPGARLFYDLTGKGVPVITIHGFIENGSYWGLTGLSGELARAGFQVADLDMRAHGRSVPEGDDPRYTVDAVAEDIGALADALGYERFVLLTHATGGMAGIRYAMRHSDRLLALICTNTSSATLPMDDYCGPEWDDRPFPKDISIPAGGHVMADMLLAFDNVRSMMAQLRENPEGHMLSAFFLGVPDSVNPERTWQWCEQIYASNNIEQCAAFARSFFHDPDPQASGLKQIQSPALVIVGERDVLLRKPCAMIARCIPNAREIVLPSRGHFTAAEDPDGLAAHILDFLTPLIASAAKDNQA